MIAYNIKLVLRIAERKSMAQRKLDEGAAESSRTGSGETEARLYKPTARECALLLLRLIEMKEQERKREVSRLRIAEISLKRLWGAPPDLPGVR
jgi:hypothetical protein